MIPGLMRRAPTDSGAQKIASVTFNHATHRELAASSDNFCMTWGPDISANTVHYTSWGDGQGFAVGTDCSMGFAKVTGAGTPNSAYTGTDIHGGGGVTSQFPRTLGSGGKTYSLISIDGLLYAFVSPDSDADNWDQARLYKSTDLGVSWTAISGVTWLQSDGVGIPCALQMGKDHAASSDGYVYFYFINIKNATSLAVQTPGELCLVRVAKANIETKASYEWYTGIVGDTPQWGAITSRTPVFSDANGVGWTVSAIYLPTLNRVVLMTEHTTSFQGRLGMFEGFRPWGPTWHQIHYASSFNSEPAFYWNLAPGWMRNGDVDFTCVYSGIGTCDSWNTVEGAFTLV